jgi:YegS/Rv2252/BmrU family lipid kinase
MSRLALVANPRSGSGTTRADLERELRAHGAEVRCFGPEQLGDVLTMVPRADRLVAAGGDGTIGPVAAAAGRLGVPLAVIATGTANDFARALALPRDLEGACRLAATGTELRTLELCRMDGRPFVNVASIGLAPRAAEHARRFKSTLGPLAYALGAGWAGLTHTPTPCRVTVDGNVVFTGPAWQVIVASTGAFGAGSRVPADPGDGRIEVAILPAGPRVKLVRYALALRQATILDRPEVEHGRGTSIELGLPDRAPFNVDGEIVRHGPARFSVEPSAFRVIVEAP